MIDVLIKNALVYDGSGGAPFVADIGITGDRIVFVGDFVGVDADRVIDARGLVASPGFIDVHGHSEFSLFAYPNADSKLLQGVTTEINGNCGFSAAPISGPAIDHLEREFITYSIKDRWHCFRDFYASLQRLNPAINFATLTGHGNLRASVLGYEDVPATRTDIEMMSLLLRDAVSEGAIGLSSGLIYSPGVYSDNDEIVDIINAAAINDLLYATHMRSEGDFLIESVQDTIEVARRTGIKIHLSHLKTAGSRNWYKIDELVCVIEEARASGIRLTCDRYPYTASQTSLDTVMPSWVYEGGDELELRRLSDGEQLSRIREELRERIENVPYWDSVMVSTVRSEKNKPMEGHRIGEIARSRGVEPFSLVTSLLIEERLAVDAIFFSMSEDNLRRILSLDVCMVGSDSSIRGYAGCVGKPHPRGFGAFPRYISRYVLSEGLMSLRDAIRKITALPAQTFGLHNRGIIREGAYADVVVFDRDSIMDCADFETPYCQPKGIEYVLVNGTVAVEVGTIREENRYLLKKAW
ncbi:MAG: D-aminoacylase [Magnetococcales bacterium]|uniref:D-aminoacylase n=1 Tax=Candidatus Magnetobacterium casense TaxID=1455061 RepID=A0ABS6RW55_9BACT|nr:D-aminoacylase [Candidatus Magnetobacterium casensis]MBF0606193.1 D-aminoacylase [Nitrospirota bacterium]MBV6340859.1 D-aminoacylase [Candidatus Magnetobacterium casensis]